MLGLDLLILAVKGACLMVKFPELDEGEIDLDSESYGELW